MALSLDASRAAEGLGLGPWLPQVRLKHSTPPSWCTKATVRAPNMSCGHCLTHTPLHTQVYTLLHTPQEATYNDMAEAMVALGMIRWMAPRASPLFDLYQSGPEAGAALAAAAARCHPLW